MCCVADSNATQHTYDDIKHQTSMKHSDAVVNTGFKTGFNSWSEEGLSVCLHVWVSSGSPDFTIKSKYQRLIIQSVSLTESTYEGLDLAPTAP